MRMNERVLVCGNIGDLRHIIKLINTDSCRGFYFVYRTKNPRYLLQIAMFQSLKKEDDPLILGVAETYHLAQKIVFHIVKDTLINKKTGQIDSFPDCV